MSPLAALLVGGAGRRMGGVAKGLLLTPSGEPIALRLARIVGELDLPLVLVGDHEAYRDLGFTIVPDADPGRGPLGGLVAALEYAGNRPLIALAADTPFVTKDLLARLVAAPATAIVAPVVSGIPQPLFARYDSATVLPFARQQLAEGRLSLQALLTRVGLSPLPLAPGDEAALEDWDTPEDCLRGGARR